MVTPSLCVWPRETLVLPAVEKGFPRLHEVGEGCDCPFSWHFAHRAPYILKPLWSPFLSLARFCGTSELVCRRWCPRRERPLVPEDAMAGRDVQRLRRGGLLLCSLLSFSLCPVRLGLAPVGGAERT